MRAARLTRPGPITSGPLDLVEMARPAPGPGELLVDVSVCGVCRTDIQLCEGDLTARHLPVTPGHQIVGRVAARGAGVDRAVGARVGITWLGGACWTCGLCRSGRENLCRSAVFTGWDRDGGFADAVLVDDAVAFDLPDGFADDDAAPLLCGGVIGFRSLRVCGIRPGQRLGLYGFGASATVAVQVARYWGCEIHVATRSLADRERALGLGAASVGGYDDPPPAPLDAAITFAPAGDVVVAALAALDRGGTVAVNAIHLDRVPEFPYELLWWERTLRSVANVTRADVRELLDLAPRIPIVTHHRSFRLDEVDEALRAAADGRVAGAALVVPEPVGPVTGAA
jgi:propanol-preferring alcohol dehydrogenase